MSKRASKNGGRPSIDDRIKKLDLKKQSLELQKKIQEIRNQQKALK